MGLVFVLLLGEIDLSAGFASGVCAAVWRAAHRHGWPWYVAIPAALITGLVIGMVLGLLVAKVGIPSFVVTLAAFLAFQGAVLLLSGRHQLSIRDDVISPSPTTTCRRWLGWVAAVVAVAGYAAVQLSGSWPAPPAVWSPSRSASWSRCGSSGWPAHRRRGRHAQPGAQPSTRRSSR